MNRMLGGYGLILLLLLVASPAYAAAAKEKTLGSFGAWRAYSYDEGGQTVCYMVDAKLMKSTAIKKRSTPYLMITHRPIEASTDVVSYGAGQRLDSKRGVKLGVSTAKFDLFSVNDTAWARDSLTDHKLAAAIRLATKLQATGLPAKKGGRIYTDIFDTTGADTAYRAIGKACGLPDFIDKKPARPKKTKPRHRKTLPQKPSAP